MNEIFTSFSGNVAGEPRGSAPGSANPRTMLRVATRPRMYDRASGQWRDGSPSFITVVCWRALAENVAASVSKGDPVVVTGRLRTGSYTAADGQRRLSVEVHASSVGHDLTLGRSLFTRFSRAPTVEVASGDEKTVASDEGTGAAEGFPEAA